MEKCDLWVEVEDTKEAQCVESCPLAAPWQDGEQCKECPNQGFWNLPKEQCVEACPGWMQADNIRVCRTCEMLSQAAPYWDGKECVAKCPETWDENKVCTACAVVDVAAPKWNDGCMACAVFNK